MHKRTNTVPLVATVFFVALSSWLQSQDKREDEGMVPCDICGKVTDETRLPLPGVRVVLTGIGDSVIREALTDATGRYCFDCLPSGKYTLVFSLQGFVRQAQQGVTFSYPHSVLLNPVMQVDTEVGENFLAHFHISIYVTSATDDKPIRGAKVQVGDVDYGMTDDCGRLAAMESPGKYRIRVTKPGYDDFEETVTVADVNRDLRVRLKKKGDFKKKGD